MALGQELIDRPIADREHLKRLQRDHYKWAEANITFLRLIFQSESIARDYCSASTRSYPCLPTSLAAELHVIRQELELGLQRLKQVARGITLALEQGLSSQMHEDNVTLLGERNPFPSAERRDSNRLRTPRSWLYPASFFPGVLIIHTESPSKDKELVQLLSKLGVKYSWVTLEEGANDELPGHLSLGPSSPSYVLLAVSGIGKERKPRLTHLLDAVEPLLMRVGRDRANLLIRAPEQLVLPRRIRHLERDSAGAWCTLLARALRLSGLQVDLNASM